MGWKELAESKYDLVPGEEDVLGSNAMDGGAYVSIKLADYTYHVNHVYETVDGGFELLCREDFTGTPGSNVLLSSKNQLGFEEVESRSVVLLNTDGYEFNFSYYRRSYTLNIEHGSGIKKVT